MRITKIATQGRQDASQWVTQYYVSYSQGGIIFTDYKAKSSRWVCYWLLLRKLGKDWVWWRSELLHR